MTSPSLTPIQLTQLLESVAPVVRAAGAVVMQVYESAFEVEIKPDESPVTEADILAEALITKALLALRPDIPVVGEEAASEGENPVVGRRFWLVDPLDGTKEFVQRNGEFTVNVALIEDGLPVLGLVFAPALDRLYAGVVGVGSWMESQGSRKSIRSQCPPPEGLRVAASRSHGRSNATESFLKRYPVSQTVYVGSSLKLCLLAQGEADVYPRFGRTMEWDIASGQAVLMAAGGAVERLDCDPPAPLRYGKPGFENPDFAAWGLRQAPSGLSQSE